MNNAEFWKAALIRAFRTFLQVILAVWTAGQLITEVDWKFLLLSAFSSAVYSMLTSILAGLPMHSTTILMERTTSRKLETVPKTMKRVMNKWLC